MTRDQKFLIAALQSECAVFSRDVENGKLELVQRLFKKPNPVRAEWIVATSDEASTFLWSGDQDYFICHYQRDSNSGKLIADGGFGKAESFNLNSNISHMLIHPKDGRLFALSSSADALLVFNISANGELELSQIFQDVALG